MRMLLVPLLLIASAVRAGADEPVEKGKDVWAVGTRVLPTKHTDKIKFGDWIDDKQEYFKLSGIMPMEVRKDKGDGWVRIHDGHREGWVQKENLVTKEDAPIFWDKAVKADPKDTFALHMRGTGWRQKGEYDNAIADFNECIRLEPDQSIYYVSRGSARIEKKEYDKATADCTDAIRLEPKSGIAYYNRGLAYNYKKDFDVAIKDYTESIRLDPKYVIAYLNRGNSWSHKKYYEKAIADYTEALRLDPKFVGAYFNRAVAWNDKKDYDKAIADYTEAIRLVPKYVSAYNNRGCIFKSKKLYDKAIQDFIEGMRIDPNHAPIIDSIAEFYATCPDAEYRDGKKAVEMAKLAIEKAGKDAGWEYSATLAAAYAEAGDFELAVSEQRKALDDKHIHATDKKEQEARLVLYRAKKPYRDE